MKIYLKGCYTILSSHPINRHSKLQFSVPLQGSSKVIVSIIPEENSIESFQKVEVSNEMLTALQKDMTWGTLSEKLITDLSAMKSNLREATRNVVRFFKYYLHKYYISEQLFSCKHEYWSVDKITWKTLPTTYLARNLNPYSSSLPLNEKTAKIVQEGLEKGMPEPFLAYRHLHRAMNEVDPRYKWIDATIAVELAIKEFLIILKPDIKTLLLEIPSPPLFKLYGSILKSFVGEESPKKKEIAKGVETRNKLIHTPKKIDIDHAKAKRYVNDVGLAIYHLLTLLPDNSVISKYPALNVFRED